ncbi:hypothetical protein DMA11_01935 [Marinilabiliaceae bacterium JC017]|nr:hypothetical protein DMA11_01935 [Marinilabiliaceae bacterium JC017]
MPDPYYTLPIKFDLLTSLESHPKCSLKESIAQHIHLVATTSFGECQFDETFGCAIWEFDFDNTMTDSRLKEQLKESIQKALSKHEHRLKAVEVSVTTTQTELNVSDTTRIKKKIDVVINARMAKTNEAFNYFEYFFLGPFSYY